MTATVFRRTAPPRSFSERAWTLVSALLTRVGEIYDRKDEAKKARLSLLYFSA